jgi:Dullard-like phosphatase family protein
MHGGLWKTGQRSVSAGRDLKKVIIMDDCPYTYVLQPRNALPVRWYYGNPNDRELQKVSDGLRKLGRGRRDIRFIVDTIERPSMTTIIGHSQLLQPSGRHTLVLDMDGTILVERREKLPENEGSEYFKTLEISDDGKKTKLYIYKRPGLDRFLKEMAELFEIVVFTASSKSRADYFLDEIDTHKFISSRLYRDSCYSEIQLKFVKDLFQLGRDLKRVIIVDDTPISYEFQQTNAIPIIPFQGFKTDTALEELTPFLRILAQKDDVRPLLYQKFDVQIRLLDNI